MRAVAWFDIFNLLKGIYPGGLEEVDIFGSIPLHLADDLLPKAISIKVLISMPIQNRPWFKDPRMVAYHYTDLVASKAELTRFSIW